MTRIDVAIGMIVVYAHRGPRKPEESLLEITGIGHGGYCGVRGFGFNQYSGNKQPRCFERRATPQEIAVAVQSTRERQFREMTAARQADGWQQ